MRATRAKAIRCAVYGREFSARPDARKYRVLWLRHVHDRIKRVAVPASMIASDDKRQTFQRLKADARAELPHSREHRSEKRRRYREKKRKTA